MIPIVIVRIQKLLVDIPHTLERFLGRLVSFSVTLMKQIKDVEELLLETNMWSLPLIALTLQVREMSLLLSETQSLELNLNQKVSSSTLRRSSIIRIIMIKPRRMTLASLGLLRK